MSTPMHHSASAGQRSKRPRWRALASSFAGFPAALGAPFRHTHSLARKPPTTSMPPVHLSAAPGRSKKITQPLQHHRRAEQRRVQAQRPGAGPLAEPPVCMRAESARRTRLLSPRAHSAWFTRGRPSLNRRHLLRGQQVGGPAAAAGHVHAQQQLHRLARRHLALGPRAHAAVTLASRRQAAALRLYTIFR